MPDPFDNQSESEGSKSPKASKTASSSVNPVTATHSSSNPSSVINSKRYPGKTRASPSLRAVSSTQQTDSPSHRPKNDGLTSIPPLNMTAPHLRRTISNHGDKERKSSRRIVFSTDDDESEIDADIEREINEAYKEGFKQGLRRRSKPSTSTQASRKTSLPRSPSATAVTSLTKAGDTSQQQQPFNPIDDNSLRRLPSVSSYHDTIPENDDGEPYIGTSSSVQNVKDQSTSEDPTLTPLASVASSPQVERPIGVILHEITESKDRHDIRTMQRLEEDLIDNLEERDEEDDDGDAASISSTETFTLRERQDAINITHPFGIRIWKPAIYKKVRSVQRIADGDIHSRPGKDVTIGVWIGNIIWSLSFGTLLLFSCWIGAFFLRTFFFWSRSATQYSRIFFSIGKYLFFPFGICVQLKQDENYLSEDEGEGRPITEYQEWQSEDRRRLFFEPSSGSHFTADNTTSYSNSENQNSPIDSHHDHSSSSIEDSHSNSSGNSNDAEFHRKRRFFGRGDWNLGRILFFIWYYIFVFPLLLIISLICWIGVFSIPMAKVTGILANHIRRHPLALSFKPASTLKNLPATEYSASILLCTYRALGFKYYKYTVDGTNIFFINLMLPVFLVIFDYYCFYESLHWDTFFTTPIFIFIASMLSIIPLAYFIGQGVASISAQSSMGMGATINAFFSTVVEVYLYCIALSKGKGDLVEGSIVGSIFGGILFLPGLSMCAGAIKRKTQRYNPKSAGVSSTMLLFAIIGAFAPTIFYQIYGTYEVRCQSCETTYAKALNLAGNEECQRCHFYQAQITTDALYTDIIKPFSIICSALLFISYVIGLWFTLRTHAVMIWQTPTSSELHSNIPHTIASHQPTHSLLPVHNENITPVGIPVQVKSPGKSTDNLVLTQVAPIPIQEPTSTSQANAVTQDTNSGGHDAPNWSRTKSTVILLGATLLYAIIAEILVGTVDGVLKSYDINEKFVGVTIFALVPNTTEFLNAISFAMNGNISLSMEIGSAYVLQVCLLQIPALVAYSVMFEPLFPDVTDFIFTLIFPRWDLLMVIFCVFVFSYIYAEGKSNYFKGSILVLSYLVVMTGFYFTGQTAEAGINQLSSSFNIISKNGSKIVP